MIIFELSDVTLVENGVMQYREKINGIERSLAVVKVEDESTDAVKEAFLSGGIWSVKREITDEEGNVSEQVYPFEEHCVLCQIRDNIDGTMSVYMGKKTDNELLEEENAALLFQILTGEEFI